METHTNEMDRQKHELKLHKCNNDNGTMFDFTGPTNSILTALMTGASALQTRFTFFLAAFKIIENIVSPRIKRMQKFLMSLCMIAKKNIAAEVIPKDESNITIL